MDSNGKLKILFYGDSPTCATGFATVSRNILLGLYNTGKYDIDIFGVNYWGDPKPPLTQIFNIYPAGMNNERDPYGREKFKAFAQQMDFDILFFLQDSFILTFLTELIPNLKASGKKFVSLCYYPCDSIIKPEWADAVCSVDFPVAYTNFAKEQTNRPDKDIRVIYHGVNPDDFFQLPKQEVESFRKQYFASQQDKTIFTNVNRNQQRKDIPRFLRAIKMVKETHPNCLAYCHCAMQDQGWNMESVCRNLGLSPKEDVVFPVNFSPNQGYPVHILNYIYNASDFAVSTDAGEGFGLCLDKHTNIYTFNGIKELKDITIEDKVLSSDGSYNKIQGIMTRPYNGDVYKITTWMSNIPVMASPEHGFMVKNDDQIVWKKAEELRIGDYLVFPVSSKESAKELNIFELVYPMLNAYRLSCLEETKNKFRIVSKFKSESHWIPKKVELTEELMKLFGLYIAEGCVAYPKYDALLFSFHKDEEDLHYFVCSTIKSVFGLSCVKKDCSYRGPNYKGCTIATYSTVLGMLFYKLFGHGARNKNIPGFLLQQPEYLLKALLLGEFRGDGYYTETSYECTFSTTSKNLAYALRLLMARLGIISSVRYSRNEYKVVVSGASRRRLLNMFNMSFKYTLLSRYNNERCEIDDEFMYLPVKSIEVEYVDTVLVDIQVENTNNFTAENVVVHNSQLEAMATKTPIIMPNNTVRPELLNDDIAYLVKSGTDENLKTILPNDNEVIRPLTDIYDLCDTIKHVMDNPEEAKEKAETAYKYVSDNLFWEKSIIPQWVKLFDEAVAKLKSKAITLNTGSIKV